MMLESILSGGFAGAAVVAALSKLLISNQLDKSLRIYQHDLDRKKDALQVELAVYAENAKFRISNHGQKSVTACETAYGAVVRTSIPLHGFKRGGGQLELLADNDLINAKYFELFSDNFKAFDKAFKSVTGAFFALEESAIYLDHSLEQQIVGTLESVLQHYTKWHDQLLSAHRVAQVNFRQGKSVEQARSMDFDSFYYSMVADWNSITGAARKALKLKVRELLTPQEGTRSQGV